MHVIINYMYAFGRYFHLKRYSRHTFSQFTHSLGIEPMILALQALNKQSKAAPVSGDTVKNVQADENDR